MENMQINDDDLRLGKELQDYFQNLLTAGVNPMLLSGLLSQFSIQLLMSSGMSKTDVRKLNELNLEGLFT